MSQANKSPRIFIGCDPGRRGGIAVIDEAGVVLFAKPIPQQVAVRRTPPKKTKSGKPRAPRMEIDDVALSKMIKTIKKLKGRKLAMIERVWARPREGVISAFTFGGAYHQLRQALSSDGIKYIQTLPTEWQKRLIPESKSLDRSERKKLYLAKARVMFPSVDLSKEGDDDVAAALLIAQYYRETIDNN